MNYTHEHTHANSDHVEQVKKSLNVSEKDHYLKDVVRDLHQFHDEIDGLASHKENSKRIETTINHLTEERAQKLQNIREMMHRTRTLRDEITTLRAEIRLIIETDNTHEWWHISPEMAKRDKISIKEHAINAKEHAINGHQVEMRENKREMEKIRHSIDHLKEVKTREEQVDRYFLAFQQHAFQIKPTEVTLFKNEIREKLKAGTPDYATNADAFVQLIHRDKTRMNPQEIRDAATDQAKLRRYFVHEHTSDNGFNAVEARKAFDNHYRRTDIGEHTDRSFDVLTRHVFKIKPEDEELFRNEIREKITAGEQNYVERVELLALLYKNPNDMNVQERNTYQNKKLFNKTTSIKDTLKNYFVEQHSNVTGFNGLEARLAYKIAQIDKKNAWKGVAYKAQSFGSEIRDLKQQVKKQELHRAVYAEAEHYIKANEAKIHEFAQQCTDEKGNPIEGKVLFEALLRNLRDVQHTSRVLQMYQDNKQSTGAKVADFVAKALGIAVTQTGNQVAGTMYNHSQGII